jgi:hypothetical protein
MNDRRVTLLHLQRAVSVGEGRAPPASGVSAASAAAPSRVFAVEPLSSFSKKDVSANRTELSAPAKVARAPKEPEPAPAWTVASALAKPALLSLMASTLCQDDPKSPGELRRAAAAAAQAVYFEVLLDFDC